MTWVCKDCGFATIEDKQGDNRCSNCGSTMEEKPEAKPSQSGWVGDKDQNAEDIPCDLDHPNDILDNQ